MRYFTVSSLGGHRSAAGLFPYPGSDVTLVNHRGLSPEFPENTLEETLQLIRGTGVRLLLDIKTPAVTERAVHLTEQYGMIDQVIVGPRTVANLQAFKELNPGLTTLGFIATQADAEAMIDAGVDYIRLWPEWIAASRDSAACRADFAARVAAFERGERDHPGSASCLLEDVASQGTPVWSTVNDMPYEGMDELIRLGATGILSDLPAELDRLIADVDGQRLPAAMDRVRELGETLAADYSARALVMRQATLLRELIRRPWEARAIAARFASLHREFAQATQARTQLARAERQLRVGDRAGACGPLDRAAATLTGAEMATHGYAWGVRETRRVLACSQA